MGYLKLHFTYYMKYVRLHGICHTTWGITGYIGYPILHEVSKATWDIPYYMSYLRLHRISGYCILYFLILLSEKFHFYHLLRWIFIFLLWEKHHFHHVLRWISVQQKYSILFICFSLIIKFTNWWLYNVLKLSLIV